MNIEELEESWGPWYFPIPTFKPRVLLPDGTQPVGVYLAHQPRRLCDYTLSAGLFHDLEQHLGLDAFARGAAEIAANLDRSRYGNIEVVRTAFAGGDARASGIVDLWYEGDPKQRFYDHTDSIEWAEPPTINSSGDLVMAGKAERGAISIDWESGYCGQFYVVDAGADFEHTILRRLP